MKTRDAAASLNLHPFEFICRLHGLVGSWSECWPEVPDGYVETLRAMRSGPPTRPERAGSRGGRAPATTGLPPCPHGVSDEGAFVLEKLFRKDRWGKMGFKYDTIHTHICAGIDDLEEVLAELVRLGFLRARGGRRGEFSLVADRKFAIEAIAKWRMARDKA
jgi:hypothetical protein